MIRLLFNVVMISVESDFYLYGCVRCLRFLRANFQIMFVEVVGVLSNQRGNFVIRFYEMKELVRTRIYRTPI